jgi:hypothetical protein
MAPRTGSDWKAIHIAKSKPGRPATVKAIVLSHDAAQAVAQGTSHGNREIEPGELFCSFIFWKTVREHGGAKARVGSFAHAYERAREEQHRISVDEGRADGGQAPQPYARGDQTRTMITVRHPSKDWRRTHVNDHEHERQSPKLRIVEMQFFAEWL